VGLSPAAARVVRWITGSADLVDALFAVTITIGATAEARAAIGSTERRVAVTPSVIGRVAGETDLGHTLLAVAIAIGPTAHAATAIGHAPRRLAPATGVVSRVA